MRVIPGKKTITLSLGLAALSACSSEPDADAVLAANLETAEGMIDAFYSFDPTQLQPFLSEAGDSEGRILGYQAWAEGGNYIVLERSPCAPEEGGTIACPVKVQDDPVQALQTGFDVTDTFHLTFEDGIITNVRTSSNDQPIYGEARRWVAANMPEVMEGPCRREDKLRVTPGDCARAMTAGYAKYKAALDAGEVTLDEPEAEDSAFISEDFEPPVLVEAEGFKLVPLGPDLVDLDYAAYMSSIEHLQETFTRSTSWPTEGIDAEAALQDMLNEERRFNERTSFAYAVLTSDGERERGCVYVRPSSKPGYDAQVSLWVTKAEYDEGFDEELYEWTTEWIEAQWPFAEVAYPGRAIEWTAWDQL